MKPNFFQNQAFSRVAPFVAFMAFIGLEQGLRLLLEKQLLQFDPVLLLCLYLPKTVLVAWMLWFFRKSYSEVSFRDLLDSRKTSLSVFSGLLVFILWINMDWTLGSQGAPAGFDPNTITSEPARLLMIGIRIAGAVIIVPIMEELFWRSFLLRYLIKPDFLSVEVGHLTLFSFATVAILFGLEHHYLFAGIMAGVVFNYIAFASRSIAHCVLSHAVANLALAVYVLSTSQWHFW